MSASTIRSPASSSGCSAGCGPGIASLTAPVPGRDGPCQRDQVGGAADRRAEQGAARHRPHDPAPLPRAQPVRAGRGEEREHPGPARRHRLDGDPLRRGAGQRALEVEQRRQRPQARARVERQRPRVARGERRPGAARRERGRQQRLAGAAPERVRVDEEVGEVGDAAVREHAREAGRPVLVAVDPQPLPVEQVVDPVRPPRPLAGQVVAVGQRPHRGHVLRPRLPDRHPGSFAPA